MNDRLDVGLLVARVVGAPGSFHRQYVPAPEAKPSGRSLDAMEPTAKPMEDLGGLYPDGLGQIGGQKARASPLGILRAVGLIVGSADREPAEQFRSRLVLTVLTGGRRLTSGPRGREAVAQQLNVV